MIIAMLIEKHSHSLVSAGEGMTEGEARMNAIYNLPRENEDMLESQCEWEIEQIE